MSADENRQTDLYRIDDIVVDLGQRRVFRGDQEIKLPRLSFDLLLALSDAAPKSLSIDELIEKVWSGAVVSPATVAKRIELLRQALGDNSENSQYIALVRSHGYRLIPTPVRPGKGTRIRKFRGLLAAVALAAVVGGIAVSVLNPFAQPPANSIAVLPFANLGHETEGEYLSDGLAMELASQLTMVPDFKVAARTSAFAFKGRDIDVTEIASQLRVGHVVTGSVQQSGERLRVSAQLVDGKDGYHVWSDSWDIELRDIFGVQDEITSAVVRSMRVELLQDVPAKRSADPDAYTYYLKSKQAFIEEREPDIGETDHERHARALSLATHALAIDPDYAPAWGHLAEIQYDQAQWMSEQQAEAYARAEATAHRALELDPREVISLRVLGRIADSWHWDTDAAANWYKRALAAAPGDAITLNSTSLLFRRLGRTDTAHRYLLAAYERDPLNATFAINLVLSYWSLGDIGAAKVQLNSARQLAPNAIRTKVFTGMIAYLEGDFELAAEQFASTNRPWYACSLYRMERLKEALAVLEELRSEVSTSAVGMANIYACRSDNDSAFAWLERAYENHDSQLRWLRANVLFEPLRADPRWDSLLDKLRLSDEVADVVNTQLGISNQTGD